MVAPATHPLAGRSSVAAAELEGERFLTREPGSGTRAVSEAALAERGVKLGRTLELGSTRGDQARGGGGAGSGDRLARGAR